MNRNLYDNSEREAFRIDSCNHPSVNAERKGLSSAFYQISYRFPAGVMYETLRIDP